MSILLDGFSEHIPSQIALMLLHQFLPLEVLSNAQLTVYYLQAQLLLDVVNVRVTSLQVIGQLLHNLGQSVHVRVFDQLTNLDLVLEDAPV